MTFLAIILSSVFIGWFAQTKKGRLGIKWALLTGAIECGAWFFMFMATSMASPGLYNDPASYFGLGVMVLVPITGIMALAVWSLPAHKQEAGNG